MSFSISGTTITQTGTDTSLAGLSGVASVTTSTYLNLVIYSLDINRLVVTGTLTFNPEREILIFGNVSQSENCLQINSGGTLNIGNNETKNGYVRQNFGKAIHFGRNPASITIMYSIGNLDVKSGGILNWRGGEIYSRCAILFNGSVFLSGQQCILNADGSSYSTEAGPQIRANSTSLNVQGLTTHDFILTLLAAPSQFVGYKPIHSPEAVGLSSTGPIDSFLTLNSPDFAGGNDIDLAFWAAKWLRVINCKQGSAIVSALHPSAATGNRFGLHEIRQTLIVAATNSVGTNVPTFGIYVSDVIGVGALAGNTVGANESYTSQREYAAIESSGTAQIASNGGVLTAVHWLANSTIGTKNKRGNSGDDQDLFDVRIRKAGFQFQTLGNVTMKGAGGTQLSTILRVDPAYTQADVVAQAHTGISISESLVSWQSKSWGITVTANKSINPSLTIADVYCYLQWHLAKVSTAFNGRIGGAWHNMLKATGSSFETENGIYNGNGTIKGVRVVDEAGNPFPGVLRMQSDDGSYYVPPIQYTLTLSGLLVGSDVVLLSAGTNSIITSVDESTLTTFTYSYTGITTIDIGILMPGYVPLYIRNYSLQTSNTELPIKQLPDRNYQ